MKVVTLRARVPGAAQIKLHPRLTLLLGTSEADREAIRSTFAAITDSGVPGLEALIDIDGVTVPLDPGFSPTYDLGGAPSAVLEVPDATPRDPGTGFAGSSTEPEFANASRIATLRAEERAIRGELSVVGRALGQERDLGRSSHVTEPPAARAFDDGGGGAVASAEIRKLVERLRPLVGGRSRSDAARLADRLDELGGRQAGARDRARALAQLMAECDVAIRSAEEALDRAVSGVSEVVPEAVEIAEVRDEMLEIAAAENLSRKQRRRLAELRRTEQTMLEQLGHSSYAALVTARSGRVELGAAEREGQTTARLDLLAELQDFWQERQDELVAELDEEEVLLGEAAALLGQDRPTGSLRSPRLAAARLRAAGLRMPAPDARAERVAARLADALGLDPGSTLDPVEILELAESALEGMAASSGPSAAAPSTTEAAAEDRMSRIRELEDVESDLQLRLQGVAERLAALERASNVPLTPQTAGDTRLGLSGSGRDGGARFGSWSLVDEVEVRRAQPSVGGLPVLVIEPPAGGSVLDRVDPLSVVALGASTQIVWITDRAEVAAAVEEVGDLASVIRV